MSKHTITLETKTGERSEDDATPITLYRAVCSCGWKARVYKTTPEGADKSHTMHIDSLSAEERTAWWYANGCPPIPGARTFYPEYANISYVPAR